MQYCIYDFVERGGGGGGGGELDSDIMRGANLMVTEISIAGKRGEANDPLCPPLHAPLTMHQYIHV